MVPYKDHGTLSAKLFHFNRWLSNTRIAIENTFGLLKSRFKLLQNVTCAIEFVPNIILKCVMLHNIYLSMNDLLFDDGTHQSVTSDDVQCTSVRQLQLVNCKILY
jgi:DDE superfamily endonuclease